MIIALPWPDKCLSPNSRVHFRVKAPLVKQARQAAWALTRSNIPAGAFSGHRGPVTLSITFHPPNGRRRDLDNMLSSAKSLLDGVADALGIDDSAFELHLRRGNPIPGVGAVVIVIDVVK